LTAPRRAAVARRRRLVAAVVTLALALAAAYALAAGSKDGTPNYAPTQGGAVSVATPSTPSAGPQTHARHPAARFTAAPAAVALADTMSLERQVAQLFVAGLDGTSPVSGLGTTDWGGVVISGGSPALAGSVVAWARRAGDTAPLIAANQPGGPGTAFPSLPPQPEPVVGASGDAGVAAAQARLAGERLKAASFNMTLAPLADVDTVGGPLSGRLFSADPGVVAGFTRAALDGYASTGVISAVGHFPGTGAASADPDQMSANVGGTLAQLQARDLVPFAAISTQAPVIVMSNAAYVALDGVTPAGLSAQAVGLLRSDYSYGGVVMTDDLDAALQATGSTAGPAALDALRAGDDLIYISGAASERVAAYDTVLSAARASASLRMRVRAALLRVLTLKARYRLLK
jgi:beta-N-acetylhexosaminidase